jgi:uncharacterized protein (TIGR00251 family)
MIRETATGCTLAVRAQPGARKTAITGIYGDGDSAALKVAVQAPPIDGRANEALIAFLAKTLGIPRSSIELVSGESSKNKAFLLGGISSDKVRAALNIPAE